ncbi:hypothetical protein RBSWK_03995 [Rhodopirellula baltica SWK14]|uniref:Uncharacterized protein n=1 Tax=Rhodopirellula baltica SWK14 TaxID=993516 RepID=L7CGU4_RHOBT|nr:hypothetical protein RBSWK_03995 [Rhodopirellula baltica SWK14]
MNSTNTISARFHRGFKSKLAPEMLNRRPAYLLALRVGRSGRCTNNMLIDEAYARAIRT